LHATAEAGIKWGRCFGEVELAGEEAQR